MTYNTNEVATVLGICRNSAYNLVRSAGFPSIRIGKRIVVPIDALERWMRSQSEKGIIQLDGTD